MTFREIKDLIRKITADRMSSNQVLTQEVFLGGIVNDAVIPDLVGRRDWSWKERMETASLSINTFKIQMLTTLQDIKLLILHTGVQGTTRELKYKTPPVFFKAYPDPGLITSALPTYYTMINREVWFDAPINGAYSLRMLGLRRFDKLVNDADTPTWLDDDKHMLLVYGGAGMVYATIEDQTNTQIWFKLYENSVEQWWGQDQKKQPVHLGAFKTPSRSLGEYWKSPFILEVP